jgi:hypothetical protein
MSMPPCLTMERTKRRNPIRNNLFAKSLLHGNTLWRVPAMSSQREVPDSSCNLHQDMEAKNLAPGSPRTTRQQILGRQNLRPQLLPMAPPGTIDGSLPTPFSMMPIRTSCPRNPTCALNPDLKVARLFRLRSCLHVFTPMYYETFFVNYGLSKGPSKKR